MVTLMIIISHDTAFGDIITNIGTTCIFCALIFYEKTNLAILAILL